MLKYHVSPFMDDGLVQHSSFPVLLALKAQHHDTSRGWEQLKLQTGNSTVHGLKYESSSIGGHERRQKHICQAQGVRPVTRWQPNLTVVWPREAVGADGDGVPLTSVLLVLVVVAVIPASPAADRADDMGSIHSGRRASRLWSPAHRGSHRQRRARGDERPAGRGRRRW